MPERIYIAEDESTIRETVKSFLESEGYEVEDFENGDLLFEAFQIKESDLVILDVMMPGSSGFDITRKLREISAVPIILLTAKDSDLDYATGINLGSDDYFTKPFSAIALNMRVKAMLRRVKMDLQKTQQSEEERYSLGDIQLEPRSMKVTVKEDTLDLTPNEYSVLLYLLKNKDRAVSREELLDNIWGYGKDIETRACDDTVRRLRKKLANASTKIETIWGYGFSLKEQNK